MPRPAQSAIDGLDLLADALLTASGALVAIAVRSVASAPLELTVAQHRVLVLLTSHHRLTVTAVARHLGVDQSRASRHCSHLERRGLATRRRSESDGRVTEVRITDAGHTLVRAVMEHRRQEIHAVLRRMEPADARVAATALANFGRAAGEPPVPD